MPKDWYVYLLECSDQTLYTGITTDVDRRLAEHNAGVGAKYTKGRGPVRLLAFRCVNSRSDALKLEAFVKKQPKVKKVTTLMSDALPYGGASDA